MKIGIGEGTVDTGRWWLEGRLIARPGVTEQAIAVDNPAVEAGNRSQQGAIRSESAAEAIKAASKRMALL